MTLGHLALPVRRPRQRRPVGVAVERAVIEPLRLEEYDRVVVLDRADQQALGVVGIADGITVFSPQTWVKIASTLWLCVWPPKMPPPHGARTVTGAQNSPAER